MKQMLHSLSHWALGLLAAFIVGPLASLPLARAIDPHGTGLVSVLTRPVAGVGGVVLVSLASLVVGVVGVSLGGVSLGMLSAGIVLAWGAWRFGTVVDMAHLAAGSAGASGSGMKAQLVMMGVQGLGLCLVTCLIALVLGRRAMGEQAAAGTPAWLAHLVRGEKRTSVVDLVQCVAPAAACAVAVAAICATSTLKGQTLFAALAGGIAAGVAAQLVAVSRQVRISPAVPGIGVVLAALIAPLIALAMHGDAFAREAIAMREVWCGRVMPMDWAAGLVLGVPIGMGWAGSTLSMQSGLPARGLPARDVTTTGSAA